MRGAADGHGRLWTLHDAHRASIWTSARELTRAHVSHGPETHRVVAEHGKRARGVVDGQPRTSVPTAACLGPEQQKQRKTLICRDALPLSTGSAGSA